MRETETLRGCIFSNEGQEKGGDGIKMADLSLRPGLLPIGNEPL
jgi:hypothetical protein